MSDYRAKYEAGYNTESKNGRCIKGAGYLERWQDNPKNGCIINNVYGDGDDHITTDAVSTISEILNSHGCDASIAKSHVSSTYDSDFCIYTIRCKKGTLTDGVFDELVSKVCVDDTSTTENH